MILTGFVVFVVLLALERKGYRHRLHRVSFFGPLFFVWLGASLDLRALADRPVLILLGLLLGAGAVLSHSLTRLTGQPLSMGSLAAAQIGVPVAAATLGMSLNVLDPGEPAALVLGALVTVAVAALAGGAAAREQRGRSDDPALPQRGRRTRPSSQTGSSDS